MRYQMRQRFWSLADRYDILDDAGQTRFAVHGRIFTIGNHLTMHDAAGQPLLRIDQKLLSWGPTYRITTNEGEPLAIVKKHLFTLLRCQFTVDVPGPDDLLAQGSLLDFEYTFTRHDQPVANVSKKFFSLTDTYGVDIADGEDDALILASVVVIDLACHSSSQGAAAD